MLGVEAVNCRKGSDRTQSTSQEEFSFLLAFGGCDTTSGIHEKGKSLVAKLLAKFKEAQELANIFLQSNMS